MGRYLEQNEPRSELQQRIAADMRAKALARAKEEGIVAEDSPESYDGVDDMAYLKGTKQTTSLDWIWGVIFLAIVGVFVFFVVLANR